jgi:hypothetical protein
MGFYRKDKMIENCMWWCAVKADPSIIDSASEKKKQKKLCRRRKHHIQNQR